MGLLPHFFYDIPVLIKKTYIYSYMIYLTKGKENTLTLNINNNSRRLFLEYILTFTHIMSKDIKSYTIDLANPNVYYSNERYCTIVLDLVNDDLVYLGQYVLNITGIPDDEMIFTDICVLEGVEESTPFTEYISPNEINENYIYIQEI